MPPFVLNDAHEAVGDLDVDWTVCKGDWGLERRLREERNKLLKEQLQAGHNVCYRSSGWSLFPLVSSNDMTTYEPVTSPATYGSMPSFFARSSLGTASTRIL